MSLFVQTLAMADQSIVHVSHLQCKDVRNTRQLQRDLLPARAVMQHYMYTKNSRFSISFTTVFVISAINSVLNAGHGRHLIPLRRNKYTNIWRGHVLKSMWGLLHD